MSKANCVIALRAKRLKRPDIAGKVARPPCSATLRGPPWSFVFFVFDMTGETARTPDPSHRKEPPVAMAAPAWSCKPSTRQRKDMVRFRIGPRVPACAACADGVGSGARLPPCFNTECTETPRRITEKRAMEMAVIA